MRPEASPFTPGQPAPSELFVGRTGEVERLRIMARTAAGGRLKIGFITGERGIGKSSLASYVRHLGEEEEGVAGTHIFLGGVTRLSDMVRLIFDRILQESIEKPWYKHVSSFFGEHVQKVGLLGASVEFRVSSQDLERLVHEFVPSIRNLLSQLNSERQTLLLILDDLDGLAESREFADWLKSLVDQVATENRPFPVCILVVGLPERRRDLIRLQPSLARVFDVFQLDPWTEEESRIFYIEAFQRAAGLKIRHDALTHMAKFTGGLPVVAHEIGDAVWRIARGSPITYKDAIEGTFNAAEIIGQKLVEPQISQEIRSSSYRSILRKLGHNLQVSFRRADVLRMLEPQEVQVFDHFLKRMKSLGAIMVDSDQRSGVYRFANHLYCLYFWLESWRQQKIDT